MEEKGLNFDGFKGDSADDLTRISFTKSPVCSLRKTSREFNTQVQEILNRVGFFQRPDIIPYPFLDKEQSTLQDESGNQQKSGSREAGLKKTKKKGSRKRSGVRKNEKNWRLDQGGMHCDTCVRVHRHEWAKINS